MNEFATARRICASCPVIAECQAMCDTYEGMRTANNLYGVFAGEDPRQRVNRRRRQKRKRRPNHDRHHQPHPISDYIEDDAA